MDNNDLKKQNRLMKKPVPETPEERSETEEIILDNFCGCCSSSDCTGLIPAGTTDEQEMEMYEELYDFLPEPAKKQNKPHME